MGLLGNGWDDPQSQANMALAAGLLKGNFGEGLLGASNAVQAAKENALKQQYMGMQMQNMQSEIDQRKAALAKQQQIFDLLSPKAPAPLSTPVSPGQLGSGSFGAVSPPAGMPAIPSAPAMPPAGGGIFGSMTPEKLALLKANGVDLTDIYKMSREGFERKPGSFYEDWQGRRQYIADPTKGFAYDGQTVTPMPGFLNTQTAMTLATEAPKALLNAAGKVNLRPNADGTQSPVSELSENPTLQNILGNLFPGQTSAPQPPQMPQSGAAVPGAPRISMTGPVPTVAPNGHPTISPADQKGADAETLALLQQEIRKPGADVAGLQREIDRIQRSQTQPGFPTPSVVRNPQGYGMTTQQAAQAEANKAKLVKQAESDVVPTDQRQSAISGGNYMLSVIDQAINHPGRETATGLSGTLDPRNYLPGTNAKGFQSLLDQIRGGTFMQAYQNLKGGGQITEVEGKKAENAIARLNTAQSDDEFLSSLNELRQVVANGLTRQKASAQRNGSPASFPGDNSELASNTNSPKRQAFDAMPKANTANKGKFLTDTSTGKRYQSNGLSWVEVK